MGTGKLSGRRKLIDEGLKEKNDTFLNRNEISYTLPGRNNQIYAGKDQLTGEKMFRSKRYLLFTFNELAMLISQEEDNDLKQVKFSTLYRYIKSQKQYIGSSKIPHSSCLCPTCENVDLLLKGIAKSAENSEILKQIPQNVHDFIEKMCVGV